MFHRQKTHQRAFFFTRKDRDLHFYHYFNLLQKAIKEKEFELVTIKNQKLENLCRALQEERKSLYEKVQGAGGQPDSKTCEPTEKDSEVLETPKVPQDDHPVQTNAPPASAASSATPTLETPLTKELAKLKSEQALLKEIAGSFTMSHVVPTETVAIQSQELSEGVQDTEKSHIEESNVEHIQEGEEDGLQEQRDLEMESVD